MPQTKTPTSSLSAVELLINQARYRTLARIRRICSGEVSPEISTTHKSPATRLPLEVVETIIAYLTYDTHSLRACSLTCYSWYIAAVPRLYQTLTIAANPQGFRQPNPIRYMHTLGLLPLVKKFCIYRGTRDDDVGFSQKLFNCRVLHQFSTLTNVQELEIGYLDIPNFMPRIQRYFRHFFPTVKSLLLKKPRGSRRQIIYFIGLFQHLQDLTLTYHEDNVQEEPVDDPTLVPLFTPPLQGFLKILHLTGVGLLKDMIDLFEGFQFRRMLLHDVDGMPLLLDACAKTLETLALYPSDSRAVSSFQDFDLSRNKSLRLLEFPALDINRVLDDGLPDTVSKFLEHLLSTITSSAPLKIIVSYSDSDFRGVKSYRPYLREMSQADIAEEASRHHRLFQVLREARKVRDFRLVLYAIVWGLEGEHHVRTLEQAVAEEKAKNGFNDSFPEPFVGYDPRTCRTFSYI